jgi:predicted metal-dependent peptidase
MQQAVTNHHRYGGGSSSPLFAVVEACGKPRVPWPELMRPFLLNYATGDEESSWRFNRRFADSECIVPVVYGLEAEPILVAIDLSNSVWCAQHQKEFFMALLVSLLESVSSSRIDIIYWDSEVRRHETYTSETVRNLLSVTKPQGGGGTRPSCITAYLQDRRIKPSCAIVITDGEVGSDWGSAWPCPVLWGIVDNRAVAAPTGQTVHIDSKE